MAIEINGLPSPQVKTSGEGSQTKAGQQEAGATPQGPQNTPGADTVSLTGTAAHLKALETVMASLPVVDSQRVEQLRQSVSNGSYRVDSQRVAGKLVSFESRLHGKPRG
ncbi:MAG: flagellar biosynthesis anti-sigma factor FlgM [Acidiferrobacterales bacterium]